MWGIDYTGDLKKNKKGQEINQGSVRQPRDQQQQEATTA